MAVEGSLMQYGAIFLHEYGIRGQLESWPRDHWVFSIDCYIIMTIIIIATYYYSYNYII